MRSQQTKDPSKVGHKPETPDRKEGQRDRLRDIIIVFVAYPITPTKAAERVGAKFPWLEVLSLVAKVALAAIGLAKIVLEG